MAEEDKLIIEDESIALEDSEDNEDTEVKEEKNSTIIDYVMSKYRRAENYRRQDEDRWLKA